MATVEKLLYTKKDAAYALSRSVRSIEYLISRKKITPRHQGRRTFIPVSEIKRYAAMNDYGEEA